MSEWLKVVEISRMNQRQNFHRNCIFWWICFFLVKPTSHSGFIEQSPHSSAGLCDKIMKTLNSRIGLRNEDVNVDNHPHYLIVHYRDYKATVVIVWRSQSCRWRSIGKIDHLGTASPGPSIPYHYHRPQLHHHRRHHNCHHYLQNNHWYLINRQPDFSIQESIV